MPNKKHFSYEEAKIIGEKIGVLWDKFNEFPDYYDRLEKMEKEAEKFWGKE